MTKTKVVSRKDFLTINYLKCPYCGYNNAKKRLEWKQGQCLVCKNKITLTKNDLKLKLGVE